MKLPESYLFKGLSDSQMKRIQQITSEQKVQKGDWLYQEGYAAEKIYFLKDGAVELLTRVENEFELPIAIIRNLGGCIGDSSLIAPHVYSLSARCAEDATLLTVEIDALNRLMQQDNGLGMCIMTNLARLLRARLKETRQELKIHFKNLFRSMQT